MAADFKPLLETILYLGLLFALLPVVFYVLSRAASPGDQPVAPEVEEVRRLSELLSKAACKALEEATRGFRSTPLERRALNDLIELAERTDQFKSRLRRPEYLQLLQAYERSQGSLRLLGNPAVRKSEGFQYFCQVMESLRYYFEGSFILPPEEVS